MFNEKLRERLRSQYPQGTRVELNLMKDESDMPQGLRGSVTLVDDMAQIHVNWDNGRTLALVPECDSFRKLSLDEIAEEQVHEQENSMNQLS